MRLAAHRVVGQQHHLLAGDVDELFVLGMQRAHGQEAVLRELAAYGDELAVGRTRLGLRAVDVAGLVVHVQAVHHVLGVLVARMELDGCLHVPLHDLAVEEQRGEGVAAAVEGGVQRAEAELHFGDDGLVHIVQLAVEPLQHLGQFDHGAGGRELAGADEVLAVRAGIDPVRVLRHRYIGDQGGFRVGVGGLGAIDDGHLGRAESGELAVLDRLLDAGDVEEQAGVALGRHHAFVVVAALGVVLVGGGELAVIRCGGEVAVAVDQYLPTHLHALRVDAGEQGAVLFRRVEVAPVIG
ncbi:hypothetical protein SDC9_80866 [bioreactor metagenome]|uniref:Uncharacterized protein n=1 Tax=bioreactor metagenome TaxID=1076179 RepID=A0A644Z8J1_9ZZZZ